MGRPAPTEVLNLCLVFYAWAVQKTYSVTDTVQCMEKKKKKEKNQEFWHPTVDMPGLYVHNLKQSLCL